MPEKRWHLCANSLIFTIHRMIPPGMDYLVPGIYSISNDRTPRSPQQDRDIDQQDNQHLNSTAVTVSLSLSLAAHSLSTTTAATTATAQSSRAAKLPRHLSPLWNKRHDLSLFGKHVCTMSLSEAAGHLSFMFLGMGFLETELLPLRVYAAAGERERGREEWVCSGSQ